jgi:hypothetical protein
MPACTRSSPCKKPKPIQVLQICGAQLFNWIKNPDTAPTSSPQLFKKKVFPKLDGNGPLFFILIDNLRYDQFKIINPIISEYFRLEEEDTYYSILPTATQYARNSIFSGLMPLEMERRYPTMWQNDEDEGGKNLYESDFLPTI